MKRTNKKVGRKSKKILHIFARIGRDAAFTQDLFTNILQQSGGSGQSEKTALYKKGNCTDFSRLDAAAVADYVEIHVDLAKYWNVKGFCDMIKLK